MKRNDKMRGILFESYNYYSDKDHVGADPYEVCESYKCRTIFEALKAAADDVRNWWKNEQEEFGGSVVVVNGELLFNVLRSGNYECSDEKLVQAFEGYLYRDKTLKEVMNGDSEYPLEENDDPIDDDDTDPYYSSDTVLDEDYQDEKFEGLSEKDFTMDKLLKAFEKDCLNENL